MRSRRLDGLGGEEEDAVGIGHRLRAKPPSSWNTLKKLITPLS
jgi:hypothetical protein